MSLRKDILTTGFVIVFRRLTLGITSTLILTRWLGPEGLGLYTAFMIVPLMLQSLGELGIRQSAAYLTGKKIASEARIARALISLWMFASLFSFVIVLALYYVQGMHKHKLLCVLIGISLAPAGLIRRYSNGIALGKQWISRINIGETLFVVVRLALLIVFLISLRSGVSGALVTELVAVLASGLLMLYWLRKNIPITLVPLWDKKLIYLIIKHGFKFAIALFIVSLNYKMNIFILQRFVSHSNIGQFGLGVKIAEMIWMIPAAVSMVLFSHSTSVGDSNLYVHTTSQVMRLTLLVCGVCGICVGLFCETFVRVVFGSEYLPSVPVIRLMLPGSVAAVVFKVLNANLAGRGYPLTAMWIQLGALAVNVLLNLIMVPSYGTCGSAIASSVSLIIGAVAYAWVYARKSDINLAGMFYQPVNDWRALISLFHVCCRFKNSKDAVEARI